MSNGSASYYSDTHFSWHEVVSISHQDPIFLAYFTVKSTSGSAQTDQIRSIFVHLNFSWRARRPSQLAEVMAVIDGARSDFPGLNTVTFAFNNLDSMQTFFPGGAKRCDSFLRYAVLTGRTDVDPGYWVECSGTEGSSNGQCGRITAAFFYLNAINDRARKEPPRTLQ